MDIAKLKKALVKADAAVDAARTDMDAAIDAFANAYGARAVLKEELEQAVALETARELRGKKD
jgi:hypothetical protein